MLRDKALIPLSQQHHTGLALCVATERALEQDPSQENVRRQAERAISIHEQELKNHFWIEEAILFPRCPAAVKALVDQLTQEHRQLERWIESLRQSPAPGTLLQFTGLLRDHIRVEEQQLFEQIQALMSRAELDELGAEIAPRIQRASR